VHQYPSPGLADKDPYAEDIGRLRRAFTLDVLVMNTPGFEDYADRRDALIAAVEQPGPGTLIHPLHGSMQVQVVGEAHVTESTAEGGVARFRIPFIEAGALVLSAASSPLAAAAAASSAQDASLGAFAGAFAVS
jgi:prophage DNA circulation protein